MVEGNGKSQTFWRTEPISLKPDSLYRLSFLGRWERANAEGAAIAGLGTINRDFLPTGSWTRYSYVFSCPETKDSKDYVRLGFLRGTQLPDPDQKLIGEGKWLRHVKVRNLKEAEHPALKRLVEAAWAYAKSEMKQKTP